jgi:predicted metal-dependent HD superfamily phosphohydrolase
MESENNNAPVVPGIVERSAHYAIELLGSLSADLVYHDHRHTRDVVEGVLEIGAGSGLGRDEMEIVTIAAWFHDVGYIEVYKGHEEKGAEIAERFLRENGYPAEKIAKVVGCILATRMPQRPTGLIEEVICDADLAHLSRPSFAGKNERLREEWRLALGKVFTDPGWVRHTIEFFGDTGYHTAYARDAFAEGRRENLLAQERELRHLESPAAS